MKKKKLTSKNNMSAKKKAITRSYFDQMCSWRDYPISERTVNKLREDIINEARNNESIITFKQLICGMGIPSTTLYELTQKYEKLKEDIQVAKDIIGVRREIGALNREFSEKIVMRSAHFYDKDWESIDRYHASLGNELEGKAETKIIVIDKLVEGE